MQEENRIRIGDRLCEAMQKRDMRQVDLAEKTNIPKGNLSQYMRNIYIPKREKAELIAKALNVNVNWLLKGEGEMEYSPEEKHYFDMAEIYAPISDLSFYAQNLNEANRKELVKYAEFLYNKQENG